MIFDIFLQNRDKLLLLHKSYQPKGKDNPYFICSPAHTFVRKCTTPKPEKLQLRHFKINPAIGKLFVLQYLN